MFQRRTGRRVMITLMNQWKKKHEVGIYISIPRERKRTEWESKIKSQQEKRIWRKESVNGMRLGFPREAWLVDGKRGSCHWVSFRIFLLDSSIRGSLFTQRSFVWVWISEEVPLLSERPLQKEPKGFPGGNRTITQFWCDSVAPFPSWLISNGLN